MGTPDPLDGLETDSVSGDCRNALPARLRDFPSMSEALQSVVGNVHVSSRAMGRTCSADHLQARGRVQQGLEPCTDRRLDAGSIQAQRTEQFGVVAMLGEFVGQAE